MTIFRLRIAPYAIFFTVMFSSSGAIVAQQNDFLTVLPERLHRHYVENSPLDLHLFFNQPVYAPGDTAYFKLSFLSAGSRKPVSGRAVINVDVYRQNGERVHHQQVLLKDGFGGNQYVVPASLEPGVYVIVAYNDWMLNGDESSLFYSHLKITNGQTFARKKRDAFLLFPEGGTFVAGIDNKVAIMGPVNRRVELRDENDSTLYTILLNSEGVGSISFVPEQGHRYHVSDGNISQSLPDPSNHDLQLSILPGNTSEQLIQARIFCPDQSRRKEGFFFVVSGSTGIYYTASIGFRDADIRNLYIPKGLLPRGMVCASLFGEDEQLVASRVFMVQHLTEPTVSINLNKSPSFAPRDSVHATVTVLDPSGKTLHSVVGVTVINESLFSNRGNGYSLREMLLAVGNVAHGGLKEFPYHSLDPESWDDFLIAEQWNRYHWPEVIRGGAKNDHVLKTNIHFSGKLLRKAPGAPTDTTVVTFFLQHDLRAYEDYPSEQGDFDFALYFDFHGDEDVFYRVEENGRTIDNAQLDLDEARIISFPASEFVTTTTTDPYAPFAQRRTEIRNSFQRRSIDRLVEEEQGPHVWLEDEIDGVDVAINLDDYLIFPTMEETLREIVPSLAHRWRNKQHTVRVRLDEADVFSTDDPIYFIDGVLTTDTDYFMNLIPASVASIKVVTSPEKLIKFGNLGKNGIVLVETRIAGNAERVPRSKAHFRASGLTDALPFQLVDQKASRRIPDFRACLFWAPVLRTENDGKISFSFPAADNPGKFRIIVDGLTDQGEPIYAESVFDVSVQD